MAAHVTTLERNVERSWLNASGPVFRVMVEDTRPGFEGKMLPASDTYVRRNAAFAKAEKVADLHEGLGRAKAVSVWEYAGPGRSTMHVVREAVKS